jgi:hypothetical protein
VAAPPPAAAPTPAPAPVAAGSTNPALAAKRGRVVVGVYGDSMADGLWAGLYRDLRADASISVMKFSQPSTGLSRYDYVDLHAKTQRQLAEQPVDVAVIMVGTNDVQGITHEGRVHAFGSPGWRQVYSARIDALVGLLRARGAAVYWVGLPRMKRDSFDRNTGVLNAIYEQRMRALGVPFVPTRALTSDPRGAYDAYLAGAGGRRQLMRANDGIHMSMAGYLRVADPVADRLRQDLARAQPGRAAAGAR